MYSKYTDNIDVSRADVCKRFASEKAQFVHCNECTSTYV